MQNADHIKVIESRPQYQHAIPVKTSAEHHASPVRDLRHDDGAADQEKGEWKDLMDIKSKQVRLLQ